MQARNFNSPEHRASTEFMSRQHPRGRRGSLQQSDAIHLAPLMQVHAPARAFSSVDFENMRRPSGAIRAAALIGMMHPSQERPWNPDMGEGRAQIRTGRNFVVPDRANPGETFTVRIHTNDNTLGHADRNSNAHSHAVVRIQSSATRSYLMGGLSHAGRAGAQAWSGPRDHDEANINAAHIPAILGRR